MTTSCNKPNNPAPAVHGRLRRLLNGVLATSAVLGTLLLASAGQAAENTWTYGIGTGISSLALDGDIGFTGENGGVITDVDLDNGDTADMFESAFGFAFFANKGQWTVNFSYGTLTLEDSDSQLDAEWDKAEGQLSAEYAFAQTGNHRWGVLGGVRYIDHDWDLKDKNTGFKSDPSDDWTDAIIGLTHRVPIAKNWSWGNHIDYGFGDSEGTLNARTSVNWKPLEHWIFNLSLRYEDIEYGEEDDINDNDFYYYDVEETTIGLGFLYTW